MVYKIVISVGMCLVGLVAWSASGTWPLTQTPAAADFSAPAAMDLTNPELPADVPGRDFPARDVAAPDASSSDAAVDPSPTSDADSIDDNPAQPAPTSVPQPTQPISPHHMGNDGTFHPRRGSMMADAMGGGRSPYSEEDVERAKPDAMAFFQKNSPERYKALQSLPSVRKLALEAVTTRMYLNWKQTSEKDPQLYSVIVQRVQVEDKVFRMVSDLKAAHEDVKSSQPLRDTVRSLVKLNLQERQIRLDHLAKTLKEQQDALKSDEDPANLDQLVDKRLDTEMNQRPYQSLRAHAHGGPQ